MACGEQEKAEEKEPRRMTVEEEEALQKMFIRPEEVMEAAKPKEAWR